MQSFRDPWYAACALIAVLFVLLFTAQAIQIHDVLGTSAYDLSIPDQNIWLLSQFETPFNTVRGLHAHGDHLRAIDALFVPFYLLKPSVYWLFLFQSISVAAGALFIYRIGQQLGITSRALLFVVAAAFLANPAVHNPLLWHYHSAVLASGLYFAWILAYLRGNLRLFVLLLVLLLSVREDMCFTTVTFGYVLLLLRHWRCAAWTIGLSVAWFFIAFFWLLPLFNGEGYFRLGIGSGGILGTLFDPDHLINRLGGDEAVHSYWIQLFSPVVFLPFGAPLMLLPALPSILINSLIGAYNIDIDYHYNFNAIPFLYLAALAALSRLNRVRSWIPPFAVGAMATLTLLGAADVSKVRHFDSSEDWRQWKALAGVRGELARLHQEIGPDGGVSASDYLVPFLAQRKSIYLFPNPWRTHYWGIRGENPHSPNEVDVLVLSDGAVFNNYSLVYYLVSQGYFQKTEETSHFSVYRRLKPEPSDTRLARRAADPLYLRNWPYRFTDARLSPVFDTTEQEFEQIHISTTDGPPEGWQHIDSSDKAVLDVNAADRYGERSFATIYLYARISVDKDLPAVLELGSDDGVSVWLNGNPVWKNVVPRPASLGDDKVPVRLQAGDNHFFFRLNNMSSAWRLVAFLVPHSTGTSFPLRE